LEVAETCMRLLRLLLQAQATESLWPAADGKLRPSPRGVRSGASCQTLASTCCGGGRGPRGQGCGKTAI